MQADDVEVLVVPIWPGLKALGIRSRSAAYAALRWLPPEAIVEVGPKLRRISKPWLERQTCGEASLTGDELARMLQAEAERRGVPPNQIVRQILHGPQRQRKSRAAT